MRSRLVVAVLVLALGVIAFGLWQHLASMNSRMEHPMTELTSRMKTVCFGRYLVDIPAAAGFAIGEAETDDIHIESTPSYVDDQDYIDRLAAHEQRLRSTRHNTEGALLRSVENKRGQLLFMSRTDAEDRRTTLVETFLMRPPYRVSFVAADKNVGLVQQEVVEVSRAITVRSSGSPVTSGACLEHGLLTFKATTNERFTAATGMTSPFWAIQLTTRNDGPAPEGKDLHARVDGALETLGPDRSKVRTLRRGFVSVDGRNGREYVGIYPAERDGPSETFDAKLEVEGNGDPAQTNIKLHMETTWPRKRDAADTQKYLLQDEALALWDVVIRSVRLRPGAF
jgi:Tle cognate immunity protein 4 C-terminal domain/Tle cognate immunity protein 4 N-terminal domain